MKKTLSYHFRFLFTNGRKQDFLVTLAPDTLNLVRPAKSASPAWTKLGFYQCSHCALHEDQHPYCPIAMNLADLIQTFQDSVSYEEVKVLITTKARSYVKHTTLQKGLSSLIGIYMVTSGCPTMETLKPMVRYHLPFATEEETKYRVLSMYLLAQFFIAKRGGEPDWNLTRLVSMYQDIKLLNKRFSERLSHVTRKDASLNALTILDWFAESLTFSINEEHLEEIESLFMAYFEQKGENDEKNISH
jgi:hypothetical protein